MTVWLDEWLVLIQYSEMKPTAPLLCVVVLEVINCSQILNIVHLLVKCVFFYHIPLSAGIIQEAEIKPLLSLKLWRYMGRKWDHIETYQK